MHLKKTPGGLNGLNKSLLSSGVCITVSHMYIRYVAVSIICVGVFRRAMMMWDSLLFPPQDAYPITHIICFCIGWYFSHQQGCFMGCSGGGGGGGGGGVSIVWDVSMLHLAKLRRLKYDNSHFSFSWVRGFASSYDQTSYQTLKRSPGR